MKMGNRLTSKQINEVEFCLTNKKRPILHTFSVLKNKSNIYGKSSTSAL